MIITLIHPSRGRSQKAYDTFKKWMDKAANPGNIQHIISIDADDFQKQQYHDLFVPSSLYIVAHNKNVVEATNVAAKASMGDILIYMSDDFDCPKEWDKLVVTAFAGLTTTMPALIKVDDCLQKFEVKVLTIPIMNRALYEQLGYFWHPGYASMFVDEDLFHTCANNAWLFNCPGLKFPHLHHADGDDETYRRSAANWQNGKAFFAQRKADGFPLLNPLPKTNTVIN